MKLPLVLCFFLAAAAVFADSDNFFDSMQKVQLPPARAYTVSPASIPAGIVSELVVQGENFLPVNPWNIAGVRVLKERLVDSRTMILTVLAEPGDALRTMKLNGGIPLSLEVTTADTLLSDNFDDADISDWNVMKGGWSPNSGEAQFNDPKVGILFPALPNTDNITVDWDMTLVSGKFAGILFHYRDSQNYRALLLDGTRGILRLRDRYNSNYETKLKFPFPGALNAPHHYTLSVNDDSVSLSVDGSPVFAQNLGYIYSGQIALYGKVGTALFDNVVVTHDPAANVAPVASFTASVAGADAMFNASASQDPDGSIASYNWNFGDGTTGSGSAPSHTYTANGTYNVVLTITDSAGAHTKTSKTVTVTVQTDKEAIQEVVKRFFVLLADLETRTPQDICQDFSRSPSCPAYDKQVSDLAAGKPKVQWFDVEFLSDVSVSFRTPTDAYPVKIRNKLKAIYYGDPTLYYTDGWHTYDVVKESDGKWHQCSYTFKLVSTNEK